MCAGETVNIGILYYNSNIFCTLAVSEATSAGPATGGIVVMEGVEGVAIIIVLSSTKQNIKRTLKVVILFFFYGYYLGIYSFGLRRTRVPG